jgi:hypothetical protein
MLSTTMSLHPLRVAQQCAVLAIAAFLFTPALANPSLGGPTAEAYIAAYGGTLIPAARTEIDGRRINCGTSATVLDPHYRDFGGSHPGFIVLNPTLFVGLATPVKLWIFSHECAHQTAGPDEVKADCVAVQRGRREGWLSEDGLAQVCEFMKPARADSAHFAGTERCALMQQCFAQAVQTDHRARKPTNPASHVR